MLGKTKVWIGTSWKMNKTLAEADAFCARLAASAKDARIARFVIPPFTALHRATAALAGTEVMVGAQNMHWAEAGAWTGEISAAMLVDCGVEIVELGHSERRQHFGETDETVGLKTEAAVRHGLVPLICIGESAADRDAGRADQVLRDQLRSALGRLDESQRQSPMLVAYEPVWAIGEHGEPATPAYAADRHARIASVAQKLTGRAIPCLYGGSVSPGNCAELVTSPHVDGLFIGRSAWTAEGYLDILARCAAVL